MWLDLDPRFRGDDGAGPFHSPLPLGGATIAVVPTDTNPFFHRGPVREPAYFFGRVREMEFAADLLRQGQSVAVSGPRRIGKTSLLFHLAQPEVAAAHGLGPEAARWVYLDGGMLDGLDEEWLYGAVDRALGGDADAVPYGRFVERLRALAAPPPAGQRLILALDEFELIAANPRLGPALFNRLRGLTAQYPLQFITAARDPLWQLSFAHRETLSSPFFNIFAPLPLGLFSDEEAGALLDTLSARGRKAGFAAETVAFILALAGPHPLFLQVAAYRTFAALGGHAGKKLTDEMMAAIRTQVLADLESHLSYYWNNLDAEAQYILAALPLLERDVRTDALARLETAGLVRAGNYLGSALEEHVRRQKLEGLQQAGPFLLDTRRGLAAVGGQQVHLTPTEYAALRLFMEHPGRVLTPEDIEAALWPGEISPDPERARGVVKKLRAALGPGGEAIVNRRGQGYLLSLQ